MYIAFLPINYLMMIACFYLCCINEIVFLGSYAFRMYLCMLVCMCLCVLWFKSPSHQLALKNSFEVLTGEIFKMQLWNEDSLLMNGLIYLWVNGLSWVAKKQYFCLIVHTSWQVTSFDILRFCRVLIKSSLTDMTFSH